VIWSLRRDLDGLADHFQLAEGSVLPHPLSEERVAAGAGVRRDVTECVADVLQVDAIVFHKEAASSRIRCFKYGLSPPTVSTSTRRPRSRPSSCSKPMTSRSERPRSTSISKSMSLSGRSSPRATDPNTRSVRRQWLSRGPQVRVALSRAAFNSFPHCLVFPSKPTELGGGTFKRLRSRRRSRCEMFPLELHGDALQSDRARTPVGSRRTGQL